MSLSQFEAVQTESTEAVVVVRMKHVERSRVPPCSASVDRGFPRSFRIESAFYEGGLSRLRALPSDPDQFPQVSPDEDIKLPVYADSGIRGIVPLPSAKHLAQLVDGNFQRGASSASEDYLQLVFLDSTLRLLPTTASADFLRGISTPCGFDSLAAPRRISPGITHALPVLHVGYT